MPSICTYAQLNPMGSMYFQNPYLMNPANAGLDGGWNMAAAYKAQWTSIEGAPSIQAITGDYGDMDKHIGVGINFYNERAGVINRTNLKATFAYHLFLNKDQTSALDFGLSGGILNEWIDLNRIKGNLEDQSLLNFNNRKLYLDTDFGIALRSSAFTIQGTLPNLKHLFNRDLNRTIIDRILFISAIGYKLKFNTAILDEIEPKVVYRGVTNFKDILDLGARASFYENKLDFNVMYHSTGSLTFGVGTLFKERLSLLALYTSNTNDLQSYSNGEFEIALRYHFK